jgi:hypothetical protein
MFLKAKNVIEEKIRESLNTDCDNFCAEVVCLYESCIEYLKKWIQTKEEFYYFKWKALNDIPQWSSVELSLRFLVNKGVPIDDVKCFEQFNNPKKFPECCKDHEEFCNLLAHQKWEKNFEHSKNLPLFSAIPSHSAETERTYHSAVDKRVMQS